MVNPATIAIGKGSFRAARRFKTRLRSIMTKEKFQTKSHGEDGQTFEVNEVRENHDVAVRGYIFCY